MRESAPASNQIVTLDSKSAVRVWTLNPMSRRKSHTRGSSCYNQMIHHVTFCPLQICFRQCRAISDDWAE